MHLKSAVRHDLVEARSGTEAALLRDLELLLATPVGGMDELIHDVRRRLKVYRAILRLDQTGKNRHQLEKLDRRLSSWSRVFSRVRDLAVMLTALELVRASFPIEFEPEDLREAFDRLRFRIGEEKRNCELQLAGAHTISRALRGLSRTLHQVDREVGSSSLDRNVLAKRLSRIVRSASLAKRRAKRTLEPDQLHAWRKRVKRASCLLAVFKSGLGQRDRKLLKRLQSQADDLGCWRDCHLLTTEIARQATEPIPNHAELLLPPLHKLMGSLIQRALA